MASTSIRDGAGSSLANDPTPRPVGTGIGSGLITPLTVVPALGLLVAVLPAVGAQLGRLLPWVRLKQDLELAKEELKDANANIESLQQQLDAVSRIPLENTDGSVGGPPRIRPAGVTPVAALRKAALGHAAEITILTKALRESSYKEWLYKSDANLANRIRVLTEAIDGFLDNVQLTTNGYHKIWSESTRRAAETLVAATDESMFVHHNAQPPPYDESAMSTRAEVEDLV
ncbi:hypothetical protein BDW22DRAFT_1481769 [Trametopsis cervina]|nr:hypothetical protein BDW22DRAFT_1481769 [Trametopsis cervina]